MLFDVRFLVVFAVSALVLGYARAADSGDATPGFRTLDVGGKRPAWYHPPRAEAAKRPVTVFLHGMCALPEWECPVFEGAASSTWLLCPPGPASCEGSGAMWVGKTATLSRRIDKSLDLLVGSAGDRVDTARRTLVGYSLGAPAALRVALASPGRWQRMMLVNAGTEPSARDLAKAGIVRIALVAGEHDQTAGKAKRTARKLAAAGIEARYFSMGKVGHYFDASSRERLQESLDWTLADFSDPN